MRITTETSLSAVLNCNVDCVLILKKSIYKMAQLLKYFSFYKYATKLYINGYLVVCCVNKSNIYIHILYSVEWF